MFYANVTVDTRNPVNPFLRLKPVFTEQRCAARGKLEPRGNVSYDRFTPGNFPPRDIARIYTDDSPLFSFVRSLSLSLSLPRSFSFFVSRGKLRYASKRFNHVVDRRCRLNVRGEKKKRNLMEESHSRICTINFKRCSRAKGSRFNENALVLFRLLHRIKKARALQFILVYESRRIFWVVFSIEYRFLVSLKLFKDEQGSSIRSTRMKYLTRRNSSFIQVSSYSDQKICHAVLLSDETLSYQVLRV